MIYKADDLKPENRGEGNYEHERSSGREVRNDKGRCRKMG